MMPHTAATSGSVSPEMMKASGARDYSALAADALFQKIDGGGTPPAAVRLGIVAATYPAPWAVDVRIAGADVAAPAVPVMGNLPTVGSTVVVLAFGASYVVLGQLGGSPQGIPPGAILSFGGAAVPEGYLPCTGAGFDSAVYPALANAIGDLWAPHSGATYYTPDLQLRHLVGVYAGAATYAKVVGYVEGADLATRESRLQHRHTHTIEGQAASPAQTAGAGAAVNVPSKGAYDGHAHGGATGINGLDSVSTQNVHAMAGVLFIIKT